VRVITDQVLFGLFPSKCPCCGEFCASTGLCGDCILLSFPREGPLCRVCDSPTVASQVPAKCGRCLAQSRHFDRLWGRFDYAGPIGESIKNGKNERRPENLRTVARLVATHLPEQLLHDPPDVVIPIPIHRRRLFELGFSAPATIAQSVARVMSRPMWQGAAVRRFETQRQAGLNEVSRRRNVKGAFTVRGVEGLDVLLVDDVFTTGSTMNELARVMKRHDVLRVRGLCAAYVEREGERARVPPGGWTNSARTVVA